VLGKMRKYRCGFPVGAVMLVCGARGTAGVP
jgi:hypothetical protein